MHLDNKLLTLQLFYIITLSGVDSQALFENGAVRSWCSAVQGLQIPEDP